MPADRFTTATEFADALRTPPAGRPAPALAAAKSIAVLPFANLSPDPENEYFSDGITEEIINALGHLPGLHVAARTSSFAFKGKSAGIADVGARLRVATVLEGSVRRAGSRVRITAQLVRSEEHTSELQSRFDLVCRLLLEKKKLPLSVELNRQVCQWPRGSSLAA